MAINYVNYLKSNVTTSTTLYNPTTSGLQATVIGCLLTNTTGSQVTATVTLSNGTTTTNIVYNIPIPAGNTLDVIQSAKLVVGVGNTLSLTATGATDATLSVIEVS